MCHDKGLRRRRTFILTLSIHGGCIEHYTREDSAADEHSLQVCHLVETVPCTKRKGLRRRRTFIMSLSFSGDCIAHYTREDSAADEHSLQVCHLIEAISYVSRQRTPTPTNIYNNVIKILNVIVRYIT